MFKKSLLVTVLLFGFVFAAGAEDIELNPSHPDTYVVQKGDTLWDISAVFLKSPWLWPEIWHANPQVENPHLIYPGDLLNLVYLDGQPRVVLNRSHPTVKMGPKVRAIDHDQAIKTIPLADIEPFLKRLRILSKEEVEAAPYVVAMEELRNISAPDNTIYVKNLQDARQGERFAVVTPTVVYRKVPKDYIWKTSDEYDTESVKWKKQLKLEGNTVMSRFWRNYIANAYWGKVVELGYEVADIAVAEVVKSGDDEVTTLQLTDSSAEVKKGDLVLPIDSFRFDPYFMPKAATTKSDDIRIAALNNALFGSGQRQIVAINAGTAEGVAVGDVFSVFRPEQVVRDEVMYPKGKLNTLFDSDKAKVTLPAEYAGHIMVFKSFEHVSYAIVTASKRAVKLYDHVRLP